MKRVTYPTEDGGAIHEYTKKKEIAATAELQEFVPDGINIHITGSELSRVSNIDIYFKED